MQLNALQVQNFLGLPDLRHSMQSNMLFVAGANGAGKSSLVDAIGFALTGELPRGVKLAADRTSLISDGASAGFVELTVDGYQVRRNVGSGKASGDEVSTHHLLPLCLNASRFAAMPEADRRRLLFELANVKVDRQTVADQLIANGIAEAAAERVLPLLRDGFPAAAAFAKDQAAQARGAWKAIAGENYGSQKAKSWNASAPTDVPSDEEVAQIKAAIATNDARIGELSEAKGRAQAAMTPEKRAELQALVDTTDDLKAAVDKASAAVDAAATAVTALETASSGGGLRFECPCCGKALLMSGQKVTQAPDEAVPGPEAHTRLSEARIKHKRAQEALAGAKNALAGAEQAAYLLDNAPTPSAADLRAADELTEERLRLQINRDALASAESKVLEAARATERTTKAKAAHEQVELWTSVEALLSPDGIPATLLAKAIDPINDALHSEATAIGWRAAQVSKDLTLTYGGRPYGLCSESEQWRADALFTSLIARVVGLLVLDRFDVLDLPARAQAVDWLEGLSNNGVSVVVAGTLKSKPDLGEGIDVIWIEKGVPA